LIFLTVSPQNKNNTVRQSCRYIFI